MAILDPELIALLARKSLHDANPTEPAYAVDLEERLHIGIQFQGDVAPLEQLGLEVGDVTGNIAFGRVTIPALEKLAQHPHVISIQWQGRDYILLDDSIPDIEADSVWTRNGDNFAGYTGIDVIVGIIDTGIDFRHRNFIKPDGSTRILKIWDQTINAPVNPPQGGETIPPAIVAPAPATLHAPLGYGVEYNANQINDTLNSETPAIPVRHVDGDGHGTHVAGIAAGNGKQAGGCHGEHHYIGVAPAAELIIVRLWGLSDGDRGENLDPPQNVGSPHTGTTAALDAIRYILNEARKLARPVAINCSFGGFSERMDGTDFVSTRIDNILTANSTGTSIVFAAGNDGNNDFHAVGEVGASGSPDFELEFKIFEEDNETRSFVITYSGSNLQVQVTSPVGGANGTVAWVSSGSSPPANTTANGPGGSVQVTNQPNRISVSISPPSGGSNIANTNSARWKIELRNSTATATDFHAFCRWGSSHDRKSPYFLSNTTSNNTLTWQASTRECLTVGSYEVGGQLAASSGRGPTLDSPPRTKPEICAPGVDISSAGIPEDRCAECCCECCRDFYVGKGGTSMAAPHVTGTIALMLHKNPGLTHTDIKDLITGIGGFNARPPDAPSNDIVGWGAGRVSADKAVTLTTQVNPPVTAMVQVPLAASQTLLDQFLATEFGEFYYKLGQKYYPEIMRLINTNKRVATAWHRSNGPIWVRLALKAYYNPKITVPITVHSMHITESVERFVRMLRRYASPDLVQEIERCEPHVYHLREGMTLSDVTQMLGSRAPTHYLLSRQIKVH